MKIGFPVHLKTVIIQEFIIFSCRLVGAVLSGKAYVLIIAEEVQLGDVCGGAAVEPVPERSQA